MPIIIGRMTKHKSILIVDDEVKINDVLRDYFQSLGYIVYQAFDGRTALEIFDKSLPSLVLLDLMLPDISGEEVCQRIRRKSRTPVIMLTAKTSEDDLLKGFDLGADDYIAKPFSLKEVNVRVKAVLRRVDTDELAGEPVVFGDGELLIDYKKRIVKVNGNETALTPTEFDLLATLSKSPYKAFSREQLISFALGDDFLGYDRTIDTYIKTIRQKIEKNPKTPRFIITVHGVGYRFEG